MRFPDLLATKRGRLTAFFMLYMTEGIPLGFTATAIATQMKRQGLNNDMIGAFVGSLYLPWAWKWLAGPFVDVISSDRFGRRRTWILAMQLMMIVTLLIAMRVDFVHQLQMFTAVIFLHNMFSATQDVAIDALAVNVLPENERGVANGFMFAGAYAGQAIGGSGVLFLTPVMGFQPTFLVVCGWIALVFLFIALPLREPAVVRAAVVGSKMAAIGRDIATFLKDAVRAFLGSRRAFIGIFFALLPGGAYALGLSLQTSMAVEFGLNDTQVGIMTGLSSVISALFCIVGGWLSDRFGRRFTLAWTMALTIVPTLGLAYVMHRVGWVMPVTVTPGDVNRPIPPELLITTFWTTVLAYNVFQGLYYGIRTALFMDVTTPAVAATQFTAYMAMMNFAISYSSKWLGWASTKWGYPITLTADSIVGLVCLLCLPFMGARRKAREPAGAAVPEAIQP